MRSALVGLAVVCAGQAAHAAGNQEEATTASRFAAPNGQLGAGLQASPEQRARVFAEVGFTHSSQEIYAGPLGTADAYMTGLSWIVGGGFKLTPQLELVAMLPMAWAEYGYSASGELAGQEPASDSGLAVGNLHLELSYVGFSGSLRYKAGFAAEYGPWTKDLSTGPTLGLALALSADAAQNYGLWAPETLSFVVPGRIEYGTSWVLSADAALGVHIPTGDGDTDLAIQLSPGFGYYVSETALLGVRMPFVLIPTRSGSGSTFLAAEPYARFDIGQAFINARFTLNLDEPLGFAFDQGKFWGLHVGGGGSF